MGQRRAGVSEYRNAWYNITTLRIAYLLRHLRNDSGQMRILTTHRLLNVKSIHTLPLLLLYSFLENIGRS